MELVLGNADHEWAGLIHFFADCAMVVWVRNFQKAVVFGEWLLKLHSTFLLQALGAGRYDVSIVCCEDKEIRALNKRYRGEDRATDVLAFPYHEVWYGLYSISYSCTTGT